MSQWTNEYAIIRDLSTAQGLVPIALEGTVTAGQKPPVQNIVEETEEEFFKNYTGSGEFDESPDLQLIQQMLNMVREFDAGSDDSFKTGQVLQISKPKPLSAEDHPQVTKPEKTDVSTKSDRREHVSKKKHVKNNIYSKYGRNVAVTSILNTLRSNSPQLCSTESNEVPLKLLKPVDFQVSKLSNSVDNVNGWLDSQKDSSETKHSKNVRDSLDKVNTWLNNEKGLSKTKVSKHMTDSMDKVNGWLDIQNDQVSPTTSKKGVMPFLNPSTMFKRKRNEDKPVKKEAVPKTPSPTLPLQSFKAFVPSTRANEYCQKMLERSKMKQLVQEDIWEKAAREMREIDEKRRCEAEELDMSSSSAQTASEFDNQKFDKVRLPQQRHLLTGECGVCKVMCKKQEVPTVSILYDIED